MKWGSRLLKLVRFRIAKAPIYLSLVVAILAGSIPAAQAASAAQGWPEWGYSTGGDFYAASDTAISSANVSGLVASWRAGQYCGPDDEGIGPTDNGDAPVGGKNLIYYSTCDSVVAASASTGQVSWAVSLSPYTAPAMSGKRVFVGTGSGQLTAMNASTGATLWTTALAADEMSDATLIGSDIVVSDGPFVYMIAQSTGKVVWTFSCASTVLPSSQALCTPSGTARVLSAVVASSSSGPLYVNSNEFTFELMSNGTLGWYFENNEGSNAFFSNPVVVGGTVYSAAESESGASALNALNANSGVSAWQEDGAWSGGDFAVANGDVYDTNGYVVEAWNASTGAPIWTSGGDASSGISVVGDVVFYNYGALDASTGDGLWTNPAGCGTQIIIIKKYLYCGAGNPEQLLAFRLGEK